MSYCLPYCTLKLHIVCEINTNNKIHHAAGRVSYFTEPAILWLAGTVMGEVGARNI